MTFQAETMAEKVLEANARQAARRRMKGDGLGPKLTEIYKGDPVYSETYPSQKLHQRRAEYAAQQNEV